MAIKIVACPKTAEDMQEFMERDFAPLLHRMLVEDSKRTGIQHELHVPMFIAAWEMGNIKLFMSYRDGVADGMLISYLFTPIFHDRQTLTIERWYAEDQDTAKELFEFVQSLQPALGVHQIFAVEDSTKKLPDIKRMDDGDSFHMVAIGG